MPVFGNWLHIPRELVAPGASPSSARHSLHYQRLFARCDRARRFLGFDGGIKPPFNIPITMKLNEVFKMLCEFAIGVWS
jgi:hypothetical protein